MNILAKYLPALFRITSGGTFGFTFKGIIVAFVLGFVVLMYGKSKLDDYLDKKDESRKVEAVIESNDKAADSLKKFNKEVQDASEKIGTDDIFDLIN